MFKTERGNSSTLNKQYFNNGAPYIFVPVHSCVRYAFRDLYQRIKYFNEKKMVSKLLEILSGLLILDPDPDFFPSRIPGPGVKKALNPGSQILNTGFSVKTFG